MKPQSVLILVNSPHKPQMVKLATWLQRNLPKYTFKVTSRAMLKFKIKKNNPYAIISYFKNSISDNVFFALKKFTENGGKLISLHHNISSMQTSNKYWHEWVKIKIEKGDSAKYPWWVNEGGSLYLTNINKNHSITTTNIKYEYEIESLDYNYDIKNEILTQELKTDQTVDIRLITFNEPKGIKNPSIFFEESEYFINHIPIPDETRVILFGLYYIFPKSNKFPEKKHFYSSNGGWYMDRGNGTLYYLMPGHSKSDYHENYCNIIKNCLEHKK